MVNDPIPPRLTSESSSYPTGGTGTCGVGSDVRDSTLNNGVRCSGRLELRRAAASQRGAGIEIVGHGGPNGRILCR